MSRLPLILCLIALAGSAVSAVLFLRIGDTKRLLETRLADEQARTTRLERDVAAVNEKNGALQARVTTLDTEVEAARKQREAADARAADLGRDLKQAKTVLSYYESTARALSDEVSALKEDLSAARASDASPDAVEGYKSTIAELERQLSNARNGATVVNSGSGTTAVFASRAGRSSVLTVGPGNAFVVLNFGSARGAQLGHRLTVTQGETVVATVEISDVRAHFSVAQVMPGTLRGVLHKGDSAILIR
jgi:predicted RNase H-like nuclease (RuvC/YqgF family)